MKFSSTQENLNFGLNVVGRLSPRSGSLPILNNILIQCQAEGAYLLATNLEMGVKCLVRGKTEKEGEFTVPARLFGDCVGLLSDKVDLELKEQSLEITSGSTKTKIKGMPSSEFPLFPKIEDGEKIICKKSDISQAIGQVAFASAENETRPELSGVFLKIKSQDKKIIMAATDSYRLAEGKINISNEVGKDVSVIVPGRALQELSRILNFVKEDGDEVTIEVGANQISFTYGNIEIISRLIDGAYPDYEQIIPKEFKTKATFKKETLSRVVKAASLFSRSGIYDVTLKAVPGEGVEVVSANSQLGEYRTMVEAEVSGDECAIVFNYRYVLDGLQAMGVSEVTMQTVDSANPCLFSPAGNPDYLYIIMPIRQ